MPLSPGTGRTSPWPDACYRGNPPYYDAWGIRNWNGKTKDGSGLIEYRKHKWDEGCATSNTPTVTGGECLEDTPFVILMHRVNYEEGGPPDWNWVEEDGKWYRHAIPPGLGN